MLGTTLLSMWDAHMSIALRKQRDYGAACEEEPACADSACLSCSCARACLLSWTATCTRSWGLDWTSWECCATARSGHSPLSILRADVAAHKTTQTLASGATSPLLPFSNAIHRLSDVCKTVLGTLFSPQEKMQLQIQGTAICRKTSRGELMLQLIASLNKDWHGNCKMGCRQRSI